MKCVDHVVEDWLIVWDLVVLANRGEVDANAVVTNEVGKLSLLVFLLLLFLLLHLSFLFLLLLFCLIIFLRDLLSLMGFSLCLATLPLLLCHTEELVHVEVRKLSVIAVGTVEAHAADDTALLSTHPVPPLVSDDKSTL